MTREEFNKLSKEEVAQRISERENAAINRINKEIDDCKMAYKIQDTEGNIFVFGGIENGFPLYRGNGGSKHIHDLQGYVTIEKYLEVAR